MAICESKLDNSWDMDHDEICHELPIKKEMLIGSSLIDSIGLNEKKHTDEQLSIAEILLLDYTKIPELKLLKYQTYVISQLKRYITQCKEEFKDFDITLHQNKLDWLLKTTDHLAKSRKQHEIKRKTYRDTDVGIQRNSYEFCNDYKCNFNKSGRCVKKHFVYNYVKCDISELINYLVNNKSKDLKEVSITINTINFVFNHMHDELVSNNLF